MPPQSQTIPFLYGVFQYAYCKFVNVFTYGSNAAQNTKACSESHPSGRLIVVNGHT
jgi:hypothetical protein